MIWPPMSPEGGRHAWITCDAELGFDMCVWRATRPGPKGAADGLDGRRPVARAKVFTGQKVVRTGIVRRPSGRCDTKNGGKGKGATGVTACL